MSVRAFAPPDAGPLGSGAQLTLNAEESHYLVKVRRLRAGERFELLDGAGGAWQARLRSTAKRAEIEVGAACAITPTLPDRVVLLGLPDVTATLESLTAASELAATELLFVRCERSQGRLPSPARVTRVMRAAMRQCGRRTPLRIVEDEPSTLATALAYRPELPGVFGHPGAEPEPPHPLDAGRRILVGPEGGLTAQEQELARAADFSPMSLGPWILRTPTAVTALLARLAA